MKLYNGMSPNGLRAQVFLAEKGLEIDTLNVDILKGETQGAAFKRKNSLGEVPVLELDDGTILTESIAICRYLEALHPDPSLFGRDPLEQARVEMWNRRMEIQIFATIGAVGLHEFKLFAGRVEQFPDYAASQRRRFQDRLAWLDGEMADGRPFIAGDAFSVADITGMAALMVADFAKEPVPDALESVKRWEETIRARPTWPG